MEPTVYIPTGEPILIPAIPPEDYNPTNEQRERICVLEMTFQYPIRIPSSLSASDAKAEIFNQLKELFEQTLTNISHLIVAKDETTGKFSLLSPEDVSVS